jgi:hypothetical protein
LLSGDGDPPAQPDAHQLPLTFGWQALPADEAARDVQPLTARVETTVWEAPLRRFFAEKERVAVWADEEASLLPLRALLEWQVRAREKRRAWRGPEDEAA